MSNHSCSTSCEPLENRRLLRPPSLAPAPALFLDRDGVLIEDRHHLSDPDDIQICQGAKELLQAADQHNLLVVIITNQSGISRGYFDWANYCRVTTNLLALLGPDAPIAAIYANGHGPDAPAESWRKPSPAMLLEAERDLNLDLTRSILVGDRRSDLEAGARAGVSTLVHVLTGHGTKERPAISAWAEQQKESWSQNYSPELLFLDTLLAFPPSLLSQN